MEWHAHHQRIGLPFAHPRLGLRQPGLALGPDGGLGRGGAQQAVAHGHAGALQAEVESEKGLEVWRDVEQPRALMRAPHLGDSIHDCRPSSDSALS